MDKMITIEQLKEVKERTEALHRYLNIDAKQIQLEEEQLRTQAPGFWDDQKRAEAQMKLVKGLEKWIKGYGEVKSLCDELDLAFEYFKEELVTEQEVDELYNRAMSAIEDLELKNMLRREEDQMDAVLKINAGAASLPLAIINPVIGLGAYVGQWLISQPLNYLLTTDYTITGTLSDPVIQKVEKNPETQTENEYREPGRQSRVRVDEYDRGGKSVLRAF